MRMRKACDVAQRAEGLVQKTEAQLVAAEEPQFMSLVGKPSNRTGFKTIRSEADNSLLSITLPAGINRAEAEAYMNAFDLGVDYELNESMDGIFTLTKRGAGQMKDTVSVDMGGIIATISRSAFSVATRSENEDSGVAVSAIRFDKKLFTREQAQAFLTTIADDCKLTDNMESTQHFTAQRSEAFEVPKSFEIAEGVTVFFTRADENDIPAKMYRAVIEEAYGNYGYGHIDFTSAMADPEFTDKSWDAIYYLKEVLENIVLYSGLSLEERKVLMQNALASFSSYMNGLMDSLPTSVIEQVRSEMQKQENGVMPKTELKTSEEVKDVAVEATREGATETVVAETEEAAREEGQAAEAEEATEEAVREEAEATEEVVVEEAREEAGEVTEPEMVSMTREELEALIASKIAEATAPAVETESQVERSEEESAEGTGEVATRSDESKDADTPASEMEVMMSAMRSMAEQVSALTSTVAELTGNSVVVRSSEQEDESTVSEEAKREAPKSVFGGAIFGRQIS